MDDSELHYLTYDPDEIMTEMMLAYADAGGSVIRAGDEKEMLLRGVQNTLMLAFAGIDNALRMATLRYAVGPYIDVIGENRDCYRIQATKATSKIAITTDATGETVTIPAGSSLTEDGMILYETDEDIVLPGTAGTVNGTITAVQAGAKSNSLLSGADMQFLVTFNGVLTVTCTENAKGGQDREDDVTYKNRLRVYGLAAVTTGPSESYERIALGTSSDIIDAKAIHGDDLDVEIYLILKEGAVASTIKAEVLAACSPKSERPLSDNLIVDTAEDLPYTLNVKYSGVDTTNLAEAVAAAVAKYQDWQDNVIGQVFNPDILKSYLYNAGCTQVVFGSGSVGVDGNAPARVVIDPDQRCKGTITTAVIDDD